MSQPHTIKLIDINQLRPGMYVQDVNCSWMDHPFTTNHFMVKDAKRVSEIKALGVHELYIDTTRGSMSRAWRKARTICARRRSPHGRDRRGNPG
jgi:hypothetical protein